MTKKKARAWKRRDQQGCNRKPNSDSPSTNVPMRTPLRKEGHPRADTGNLPSDVQRIKSPHTKDRETDDDLYSFLREFETVYLVTTEIESNRAKLYSNYQRGANQDFRNAFHVYKKGSWQMRIFSNILNEMEDRRAIQPRPLNSDSLSCTSMSTYSAEQQSRDVQGQRDLNAWRYSAGKNKSWRRCPKRAVVNYMQQRLVAAQLHNIDGYSFKSPLWIPQAFQQYLHVEKGGRGNKLTRLRLRDQPPKKEDWKNEHDLRVEEISTLTKNQDADDLIIRTTHGQRTHPQQLAEPSTAFIRMTWSKTAPTKIFGHIDRMIVVGSTCRNHWQIQQFVRNDSHADVYDAHELGKHLSGCHNSLKIEAHFFLDEYHGNSKVYARRHQMRMQESGKCLDKFWYGNRLVLIMRVSNSAELFSLRNTQEEFPILVDQSKLARAIAVRRRMSNEVLDALYPSSACGSLDKSGEKKTEREGEGKAKKQRLKRKARKESRCFEAACWPVIASI